MKPKLWSKEMEPHVKQAVDEAVAHGAVVFDPEAYGEIADENAARAYQLHAAALVRCIMGRSADRQANAVEILTSGSAEMREALLTWLGAHGP